jgi:hypothetical protein
VRRERAISGRDFLEPQHGHVDHHLGHSPSIPGVEKVAKATKFPE